MQTPVAGPDTRTASQGATRHMPADVAGKVIMLCQGHLVVSRMILLSGSLLVRSKLALQQDGPLLEHARLLLEAGNGGLEILPQMLRQQAPKSFFISRLELRKRLPSICIHSVELCTQLVCGPLACLQPGRELRVPSLAALQLGCPVAHRRLAVLDARQHAARQAVALVEPGLQGPRQGLLGDELRPRLLKDDLEAPHDLVGVALGPGSNLVELTVGLFRSPACSRKLLAQGLNLFCHLLSGPAAAATLPVRPLDSVSTCALKRLIRSKSWTVSAPCASRSSATSWRCRASSCWRSLSKRASASCRSSSRRIPSSLSCALRMVAAWFSSSRRRASSERLSISSRCVRSRASECAVRTDSSSASCAAASARISSRARSSSAACACCRLRRDDSRRSISATYWSSCRRVWARRLSASCARISSSATACACSRAAAARTCSAWPAVSARRRTTSALA
eukprot:m.164762 g.164762  ORF g.164762 m.164762 type:complete len:454 (-) comp9887_c0_seq23:1321-2682(-)